VVRMVGVVAGGCGGEEFGGYGELGVDLEADYGSVDRDRPFLSLVCFFFFYGRLERGYDARVTIVDELVDAANGRA